jgi:hypothetical protein
VPYVLAVASLVFIAVILSIALSVVVIRLVFEVGRSRPRRGKRLR